jgi:hypothetical protein
LDMTSLLEPILYKDLTEAKAALARHGIVIIRFVETDLEPAIMTGVKDSISSSPGILKDMDEQELDRLMEALRRAAMRSSRDLVKLYTQLLAQLGTEYIGDLVKELEGIGKLFTWERVSKAVDPVNRKLAKVGFEAVDLQRAEAISEAFAVELNEKWPAAFVRFRDLAKQAARRLEATSKKPPPKKKPPTRKRGKSGKKKG